MTYKIFGLDLAGKSSIVSWAHPTHCRFCNTRHASISCPSLDPVYGSIPRPTTSADISSLPPSKCRQLPLLHHFHHLPAHLLWSPNERDEKLVQRIYCMHDLYAEVLHLDNTGTKRMDAIRSTSCSRSTFSEWKSVAEVKIISPSDFNSFEETSETLTELLKQYIAFLKRDTLATWMRRTG